MGDGMKGHTITFGGTLCTDRGGKDLKFFRITDPIDDPGELRKIMFRSGLTRSDVARITGSSKTAVDSWLRPRGNAAARRMPGSKAALLRMAVAVRSSDGEQEVVADRTDAIPAICEHTSEVGMQIARKCGLIGQRRG